LSQVESQKSLKLNETSILQLKITAEFLLGISDSYEALQTGLYDANFKREVNECLNAIVTVFKEEKFVFNESQY